MAMINSRDEAKAIVLNRLNPDPQMQQINDEWVIIDNDTIETKIAWFFRTDSRIHFHRQHPSHQVLGVVGFIVERKTGHLTPVPPVGSFRSQMRVYEYNQTHSFFSGALAVLYGIIDIFHQF
jgi:hypothetical protein